jgi:hypothetical protein
MLTGGFGASEPGVTLAGFWIPPLGAVGVGGGTEPEAVGPRVSRIWPVAARRGGTEA